MGGNKGNDRKESYWNIIKYAISNFFKTESSTAGKVNFLFGVFVILLVILICVPSTVVICLSVFFPNADGMPWYGIIILVALAIFYFYLCASKLMNIDKAKSV